ncbi:uncharacterized protein Z518_07486 [Rhinocladiella mackenziei CBS 650.93]|uniref:Rhinocladiella mackenziei CBS 650.93 unplaced genomic scaffold supercont1.5, whole genome shotgun sequence n=1 Tax=Rhinocladiella mackenziei CBS 650.93 TaxID=1442369 RepID=A0A0D2H0J2_9EURO|nr:uncharacterized protein Z518_07486 [Rhinocladiella mackenziei CBS 650.93]KIX03933.1 hypothetical protein Z518_07486 [Rhinocladiella mackenziei CBS 650.93]
MDCEDCVDDCEECVDEHQIFNHRASRYIGDCEECNDEHAIKCTEGPACKDTCDECDFSCFDCIDWNEFEQDKSLGLSFSVPLLDGHGSHNPEPRLDDNDALKFQAPEITSMQSDIMVPPLEVPMHHQCFGTAIPYWNSIPQNQICTGNPGFNPQTQQSPLPPFNLDFGCHPAAAHQQAPLPPFSAPTSLEFTTPTRYQPSSSSTPTIQSSVHPLNTTQDLLSAVSAPSTSSACQWLMPCGTVCGASFASATDLKKHLKAVHLVKGVTKCSWQGCDSADFTTEAALTGHISKKHLAPLLASASSSSSSNPNKTHHSPSSDEGPLPFKCTYPGCPKSFMYKQVRDEHVASCHNGNKMYCDICGQFLNGEGSNFKRHMATHRPKHQHMLCKFHHLGCKKRFPRLDNLRRHEACCKFGKKAGLVGNGKEGKHNHQHHHHAHNLKA